MANQVSTLSFGGDATVLAGYAIATNERFGNVVITVENIDDLDLQIQLRGFDGVTSPSGYYAIGAQNLVRARGVVNLSYNLLSTQVGFFGSGVAGTITVPSNATGVGGTSIFKSYARANVTMTSVNPGNLRGEQWDIVPVSRVGYSTEAAMPQAALTKKWGTVNSTTGAINPAGNTLF